MDFNWDKSSDVGIGNKLFPAFYPAGGHFTKELASQIIQNVYGTYLFSCFPRKMPS
jgi:hypothetical protein